MKNDRVVISREEYEKLLTFKNVDQELLADIAKGIKGILGDRIKEV